MEAVVDMAAAAVSPGAALPMVVVGRAAAAAASQAVEVDTGEAEVEVADTVDKSTLCPRERCLTNDRR
jgi:hypothetical protein